MIMSEMILVEDMPGNLSFPRETLIAVLSLISVWVSEAVNEVVVPAVGGITMPTRSRKSPETPVPSCGIQIGQGMTTGQSSYYRHVPITSESRLKLFASSIVEEALDNVREGFSGSGSCSASSQRNQGLMSEVTWQSSAETPISFLKGKELDGRAGPMDIFNVIAKEVIKTAAVKQMVASRSSECFPEKVEKMLSRASIRQSSQILVPKVQSLIVRSFCDPASIPPAAPPQPGMDRDEVQSYIVHGFVRSSIRGLLQQCLEMTPGHTGECLEQLSTSSFIYNELVKQVMDSWSESPIPS